MSGVVIVMGILKANAGVLAQVPAANMYPGDFPLDAPLPLIGVKKISGRESAQLVRAGKTIKRFERIQVTVAAGNYTDMNDVIWPLVRKALCDKRGTFSGHTRVSVQPDDAESPDMELEEPSIHFSTKDYWVSYDETNP